MSFECCIDADDFVELSDELVISRGTEICIECNRLIPSTQHHYLVQEWHYGEFGDECYTARHTCCEICGDLAMSFMALGFCWTYGDLRSDIRDLNES